ncbi:MAG: hypothetical protein UV53_C0001G0021 [Candidatus Azambacteria bacterium GW2011_GWE1_42_9]|nr:MAG: hypothetical protein UV39_C0014G0010 [Candidatus Azambacteria bacterium GW2011_GWA2_42_62]KKS79804.1 MAG: hypothetical protein UV53_C0001G0021 [Candidatus Azambacteria bacterium GW2011_GWE1_42_9]KKT16314.1 MAG: seg [Parcubacteria group bacterium GW2011_GWC1_43_61]OGD41220.1 MAG: hypothetical protein A3K28_01575 [Candidatus Azambacteria bacterium RIFOXYB1_FULL_40_33]OGD41856.1 MAG: hypothetical protein A3I82_00575 [Candidatus Azambacteria bacterium RIFCSPLOWO2_02_FULL_42_10]OGD42593.1 M
MIKRIGSVNKKVLLLLSGGLALSLTRRPDTYFRIVKNIAKEWKKINERSLRESIKKLYQSKIIDYKENNNGTVELILTDAGKKKILLYDLEKLKIDKPPKWDNLWRLVIFDIPENKKQARMAMSSKLKELGFYPMQKSVFIHPYECKDEIDFVTELFNIVPYVRFLRVKDVDIELDLKNRFHLI